MDTSNVVLLVVNQKGLHLHAHKCTWFELDHVVCGADHALGVDHQRIQVAVPLVVEVEIGLLNDVLLVVGVLTVEDNRIERVHEGVDEWHDLY